MSWGKLWQHTLGKSSLCTNAPINYKGRSNSQLSIRFGGFYALLGIKNVFREISLPHQCDSIQPLVWTKECKHAFDSAKLLLCSATVLAAPDFIRSFKIEVNARATREGGVLLDDGMDDRHPVSYI